MSTDAKLPGARARAHAFSVQFGMGCMTTSAGAPVHGTRCDIMTAAIEADRAALRSAVVEEAAAIVDSDVDANWERAERFEEDGDDDEAETHEAVAMTLEGIARDIRALATRTERE